MSHAPQLAQESPGTPRGQPDDAGLIAESCRVPERFGPVFDRHATAIHGYIARRLGRDAADDLVAETFLVAFRQRGRYDPAQASARPWPSVAAPAGDPGEARPDGPGRPGRCGYRRRGGHGRGYPGR
jgi:hypothetical protein